MAMVEEGGGSILARTARGAGWVIAWRMATRLLGFISTLVLVRLLTPGDFGLVALATTFAIALEVWLAIGVEDQIVRARAPTRSLYDTAFTLNLLRSLLIAALVAASAEAAAGFFGDARLAGVLYALAATTALGGLGNVGCADFRRDLAFDKEFRLLLLPRLAGIAATISLAFLMHSHWALVAGIVTTRLVGVPMGYIMHPYRPRLSLRAWRELAGVSFWTWAFAVSTMVRDRMDSVVIGRSLGPAQVGVYSAAWEVASLPSSELVDPICRACMPGFAAALRSGSEGAEHYLRIIALTGLLSLPAGAGISLVAGPVVGLAFGAAWLEAVPVVAVLGLALTTSLFGLISAALLNAHTKLQSMVWIALGTAALRIVLLVTLTPWLGLLGGAIAMAITLVAEQAVLVARALHHLGLRPARLLAQVWRPLVAVVAMAAGLWWAGLGWAPAPLAAAAATRALLAGVTLGALLYFAVLGALWVACGQPAGAERDLLALTHRLLGRLAGWLRRGTLACRGG
jgi:lipopolysaccharide exporter